MTADPFRQVVWPFAVAETVVWAIMYYLFPAMLPEWERGLGWSKTGLSGAFTLSLVVSAVLGASVLPGLVVAFVILQGAGYGVTSIVHPAIVAELLGRRNFGVIAGMLAVPIMSGYAAAPTLAAFAWQYGGYELVLVMAITASILGLIALATAWRYAA